MLTLPSDAAVVRVLELDDGGERARDDDLTRAERRPEVHRRALGSVRWLSAVPCVAHVCPPPGARVHAVLRHARVAQADRDRQLEVHERGAPQERAPPQRRRVPPQLPAQLLARRGLLRRRDVPGCGRRGGAHGDEHREGRDEQEGGQATRAHGAIGRSARRVERGAARARDIRPGVRAGTSTVRRATFPRASVSVISHTRTSAAPERRAAAASAAVRRPRSRSARATTRPCGQIDGALAEHAAAVAEAMRDRRGGADEERELAGAGGQVRRAAGLQQERGDDVAGSARRR